MRLGINVFFVFSILILSTFCVFAEDKVDKSEEEMFISGIGFDRQAQTPVVLLLGKESKKILPIWIGLCEARSIELSLSGEVAPRPLTYDMVAALIRTLKAKVERVTIVDLRDRVYYAQIEVSLNGNVSKIDARPSDALALGLRMGSTYICKEIGS
ncbi:MAG: hypothetical protein KatS3mg078_0749 [Deltaproteobacteria bacterium]|nr:MAG: hypothetical protein KatS3mg078_0749 [Deltaproteobacteria bacterium]